jgi:ABC-type transport system involved in multi-copper enzyme maturation permease subunit
LLPVLGLLACTIPVLAILGLLGGVDPESLVGAALVSLGVAVLSATLAMTVSVWATRTQKVLFVTYSVILAWIGADFGCRLVLASFGRAPQPTSLAWINPFWLAFAPFHSPGQSALLFQSVFLASTLALATGMAAWSVARTRAVAIAQFNRLERPRQPRVYVWLETLRREVRWLTGPSLDRNPVTWREWHGGRPTRVLVALQCLYAALAVSLCLIMFCHMFVWDTQFDRLSPLLSGLATTIGLLMLSVTAATSLSEERVRGSLDVLLATPLSTPMIVWGKWWSTFRRVFPVIGLPYMVAHVATWRVSEHLDRWTAPWLIGGLVISYSASLTSLGLALATWMRRPGRAAAAVVSVYVGVTAGAIALATLLYDRGPDDPSGAFLCGSSPFFGVVALTVGAMNRGLPSQLWDGAVRGALFWIVADASGAALLLWATVATFDRCMGRTREKMRGRKAAPADVRRPEREHELAAG